MLIIPTLFFWLSLASSQNTKAAQLPEVCYGGFCLPKHLCPTGYIEEQPPQREGPVTLNVDELNECRDFLKVCCIGSSIPDYYSSPENITELTDVQCGVGNTSQSVYSIGSILIYADYGEFPWTVIFFNVSIVENEKNLTYVGGGSLIHPKFVVTTGHTLTEHVKYVARFGEWYIKSDAEIYPVQDIEVKELILHPEYMNFSIPVNNIALAVLERNVIYTEHIRPICLPDSLDVFTGQRCIATGWGVDLRTQKLAPILKRIELPVVEQLRCLEMLLEADADPSFVLHHGEICAGGVAGKDMCDEDGGSPLVCPKEDGTYVLAGITSWGVGCGIQDVPGVYVNVANYSSWISDTIESYGKPPAEREMSLEKQDVKD